MNPPAQRAFATTSILLATFLIAGVVAWSGGKTKTGPQTEKRFPPLKVPKGFKATLFACDPFIEYPSTIALGPRQGTLFVAIDYMTGLGTKIIRRDEVRLIEDTNNDGYADKSTVFAKGFNSIQGMTFYDGTVYVMHAPFLTSVRDTNGDGKADERKELLNGLGLPPEKNPPRLHCANGLVMGHDGWLYLALGDHGCNVPRPEGDRLIYNGGGILRCRADGRDLHVFATGLRNIYDVALDDKLNVFVRDNENDGGDYMIRVCHSFFGADHGYPYLYYERPEEAMLPIADLGRGSSAGGACYLEPGFPAEFRGNLFFCEWGRSIVRYAPKNKGSGFGQVKEIEFAAGAPDDPYGFKPTDAVVDYDGSLLASDWADGQRPKRGRGRIYRISAVNAKPLPKKSPDLFAELNSPSYLRRLQAQAQILKNGETKVTPQQFKMLGTRARMHAVWILAKGMPFKQLQRIAFYDPSPDVRIQAVRAIADMTDPVLLKHRLKAGRGANGVANHLAMIAPRQNAQVLREIVIALGRLKWRIAPIWLKKNIKSLDPPLAHACMQTLRKSDNWPDVLKILDDSSPMRDVALPAIANQYEPEIVDGLIKRLKTEAKSKRRQQYADVLTRIYKKPKPWVYWGYRPAPRPANTIAWAKTNAIADALDGVLRDSDFAVRFATLKRMQRENVPTRLATLSHWLEMDRDGERVIAILKALQKHAAKDLRPIVRRMVLDKKHETKSRLAAVELLTNLSAGGNDPRYLPIAKRLEDGPVLAAMLRHAARWPQHKPIELLQQKLTSKNVDVSVAAIDSLADLKAAQSGGRIQTLLKNKSNRVRRSAVRALGKLKHKQAADEILRLIRSRDSEIRSDCLESLRLLEDSRVVLLAGKWLEHPQTQLTALRYLHDLGGSDQISPVAKLAMRDVSMEVLPLAIKMMEKWRRRDQARRKQLEGTIAEVQSASGVLLHWQYQLATRSAERNLVKKAGTFLGNANELKTAIGSGVDGEVDLWGPKQKAGAHNWLAFSDVIIRKSSQAQVITSADGPFRIWLNGRLVFEKKKSSVFRAGSDQFDIHLKQGRHRFFLSLAPEKQRARFHLRFRRKSSKSEHEKLIQTVLSRRGSVVRGRELFLNIKKSQCLKCHRFGEQGERIGPDLAGIGKRFSRIHIVESILQPSRSIAPSYQTQLITLTDGRAFSGTIIAETEKMLTIGDKEGKKHKIAKSAIDTRIALPQSIMPEGLERQMTQQEFVDLVAFLQDQK